MVPPGGGGCPYTQTRRAEDGGLGHRKGPGLTEESIEHLLVGPRERVEAYLAAYVGGLDLPGSLVEAVRYALLGGGKRLRPVLCWYASIAAGGSGEDCLAGAAAVELIHAFSLVHDDLPAMDDDDLRRGKPTLHLHAGEPMAILAGDAMLTLAFDVVVRDAGLSDASRVAIMSELTGGTTGMIAGQVYDTLGGLDDDLDDLAKLGAIHHNKTGALLRAACRIGVVAASGSEKALAEISAYADAVGLMFQIVDDLIDVEQSAEHTGKRTGKDEDAGKLTYPALLGIEESWKEVGRLSEEAGVAAGRLGGAGKPLVELARYMARRTR